MFGSTNQASKTPQDWALLADLTNDGRADLADYAYLAIDYNEIGTELPGDLERSGRVDSNDVELFTYDWLEETIWHEP